MKKVLKKVCMVLSVVVAICLSAASLVGCGAPKENKPLYKNMKSYVQPIKDGIVNDESVLLVKDGEKISGKLLFEPTEIISVKQNYSILTGKTVEFTKDTDYKIEGREITALNDKVPYVEKQYLDGMPKGTLSWENVGYNDIISRDSSKYLPFTEGAGIVERQLCVSYKYDKTKYDGGTPIMSSALIDTVTKLKSKEKLEMFVYGDSISTGANTSKILDIPPYRDIFPNLIAEGLTDCYGSVVNVVNKSVGAWTSGNGVSGGKGWIHGKEVNQKGIKDTLKELTGYKPDLALIHFGLNDGCTAFNMSPMQYKRNIETIISEIRTVNVDCQIILINPQRANPNAPNQSTELQKKYIEEMKSIATSKSGVAVVDFGGYMDWLLGKKEVYNSLSANGVNHPNDFIAQQYAYTVLSTMVDYNEVV